MKLPGILLPDIKFDKIIEHFDLQREVAAFDLSNMAYYAPYHNKVHSRWMIEDYMLLQLTMVDGDRLKSFPLGLFAKEQRANLASVLFHDFNHSAGRLTDDKNIQLAITGAEDIFIGGIDKSLIKCTEYMNGTFTHEPTNFNEECIRDADLMTIYHIFEEPELVVQQYKGLATELNIELYPDYLSFTEKNHEFLVNAKMYTKVGQFIKERFLDLANVELITAM